MAGRVLQRLKRRPRRSKTTSRPPAEQHLRPTPARKRLDEHRSIERLNRTLLDEWAYARPYNREADRTRALAHWLHRYNHHRVHTAIGGPPTSRVTNLGGRML
jgi:hypothetical protein